MRGVTSVAGDANIAERLFVAVPLSEEARSRIAEKLRPIPGRLVPPRNWHFTLRFLGDTPLAAREKVIAALRQTQLGKVFNIRFDGIGAFPRAKRARIIWLGVSEGADQLVSLATAAESAARRAGFAAEKRPFKPHLTLSRIESPRSVVEVLAAQPPLNITMEAAEVALVRSSLGTGPARYETIAHFDLRL